MIIADTWELVGLLAKAAQDAEEKLAKEFHAWIALRGLHSRRYFYREYSGTRLKMYQHRIEGEEAAASILLSGSWRRCDP